MAHDITIGVSVFGHEKFSFFSNGGHQNVINFAKCLSLIEGVSVILINAGSADVPEDLSAPPELLMMRWARLPEVIGEIDLLIECGAQISAEDVERVHARGGKAVTMKYGNTLIIDSERAIHDLPSSGASIYNGAKFDECWTTSQHAETCASLWEACYRCPVRTLPHVWEPIFIEAMSAALMRTSKIDSRYKPGREKKRIIVAEPNINWCKVAHLPMLIVEHAWRERPDLIDMVMVTNSEHMKERLTFKTFAKALDVVNAKTADGHHVMSFEARYNLAWLLGVHGDVLVSHCWIDTPNYLHMDTLFLGFPLVHNISELRDAGVGYWYPKFDAKAGAVALIEAMTDENCGASQAYLETKRATWPANIEAHRAALVEIGVL